MRTTPSYIQDFERLLLDARISFVESRKRRGPFSRSTDLAGAPAYMLFPDAGAIKQIAVILRDPHARLTLTAGQSAWFTRLEQRGWMCTVWYGVEDAAKQLQNMGVLS